MTEGKLSSSARYSWRQLLPGFLISALALFFLFRYFDWRDVMQSLRQAEWGVFSLVLPIYLISYLLRAMAWRTILKEAASFQQVFLTMNVGYLLNNILPFRLGELGRAFLLGRDSLGFWRVFSSILIERAFDMIIASSLLLGSLPFVLESTRTGNVALLVGSVVSLGLFTLYLLASNKEWVSRQFERLASRWPLILRLGEGRLEAFLEGLEALTKIGRFTRVFAWMVSSWGLAILTQYLILRSFYQNAQVLHVVFGFGVSSLGVAVPSSPSYIGVYEAALVGALSLFGIPPSTAFAHALTSHVLYVVVTGVFGLYGLTKTSQSLTRLFYDVRSIRLRREA